MEGVIFEKFDHYLGTWTLRTKLREDFVVKYKYLHLYSPIVCSLDDYIRYSTESRVKYCEIRNVTYLAKSAE